MNLIFHSAFRHASLNNPLILLVLDTISGRTTTHPVSFKYWQSLIRVYGEIQPDINQSIQHLLISRGIMSSDSTRWAMGMSQAAYVLFLSPYSTTSDFTGPLLDPLEARDKKCKGEIWEEKWSITQPIELIVFCNWLMPFALSYF